MGETIIEGPLYAPRKKVYPQAVHGRFRRIKWTLLVVGLAVYYLLPFVRWDRGPGMPNQAVLLDLPHRRFYFFFIELWPQEVYYFTGLLIIAAMALFLMNALAGRIWCGYLCPQTIWTDLFYAVERWVEGDRRDRILKDKHAWTFSHLREVATKHFLWLMIAWWTGGAWVLYFADAPTLVKDLATFQAPFIAYLWIGILTATTYVFAGHAREQVCIYMCPWPRIQAALTDEWALNVTYRRDRGEPRTSIKKAEQLRLAGEPAGDCVDCHQCINVCPTGVDIRNGISSAAFSAPVHRCLRRDHAAGQPADRTDRLRYRHQCRAPARRQAADLPFDPGAHRSLRRHHRHCRRHHAVHAGDPRLHEHQCAARAQPPVRHLERRQRPQRLHRALPQQGRRVPLVRAGSNWPGCR
jgi:ferredoxin